MLFSKTNLAVFLTLVKLKKTILIVNASQPDIRLMSNNDNNDIELYRKAKIKASGRFFNLIVITNKYIETFIFRKDCLKV